MKPVFSTLRKEGHANVSYIDDTIRLGAPYDIILTPRNDWVLLTILFQQIISLVPKTVKINEIK